MKARRIIALLVLVCLLAGCGAATEDAMMNGVSMDSASGTGGIYEGFESGASTTGGSPDFADQKLITTVEVNAETEDLDALMAQLTGQIAALEGYIEFQDTY